MASGMAVNTFNEFKVDVVNGLAVFKTVNQIKRGATDAFDGGQAQLHGAGGDVHGLGAKLQGTLVGLVRIFDTKGQTTGRRTVLGNKVSRLAFGLAVDDEIDLTLAVQQHIFGAVACHQREAELFEQGPQAFALGRGEFHKFKAAQTHGVVGGCAHGFGPVI